tara:strand:- start:4686 stop:5702 length:1017 start_codon:yes stop_codon:yes gene_type:complete
MADNENEVVENEITENETTEEEQSLGEELREAIEAVDEPTEEPTEAPVEQVSAPVETGVAEEATGVVAPEHWPTEEREAFDALPDEAKTFALTQGERLYSHHQKRVEELASEREVLDRLKPLEQEIAPYREQLRLQGVAEQDVVRQLMAVRHSLQTAPADTIRWLAQQTGVDLNQIETETLVDPTEQRLAQVEQQVQQSNQANAQAIQQQQHNVAYQQAENALGQFMSAKDENGNLLHPHVENVQVTMTELANADISANKLIDLEDLYQRAIWQNAETRDAMLKERDGNILAEQKQNQKQRVSRAKRANTTIRSTADSPATPKVTLRQELSNLLDTAS